MNMSRKGLKMNISKSLKSYDLEKSDEVTTDIRGQHDFTNGYRFIDEDETLLMVWKDENIEHSEKAEKMKEIFTLLDKHGFTDYIEYQEKEGNILLKNYRD